LLGDGAAPAVAIFSIGLSGAADRFRDFAGAKSAV